MQSIIVKRTALLLLLFPALAITGGYAQEQKYTLHVTSYKYEYVGDKPAPDCSKVPCVVAIFTVEGDTLNPDSNVIHHFLLQCKSWILTGDNTIKAGKCRGLRVGGNYNVVLDGVGNECTVPRR